MGLWVFQAAPMLFDFGDAVQLLLVSEQKTVVGFRTEQKQKNTVLIHGKLLYSFGSKDHPFYVLCVSVQYLEKCPGL